jgi:hypothetical protein
MATVKLPTFYNAYNGKGNVFRSLGKYQDALKSY